MSGNRIGKVAVGLVAGMTLMISASGQTAPPPRTWTTVNYQGLLLRVPAGVSVQTRTSSSLVMTKITPPKFYATVWVIRDPNHSAYQNASYLASRHAARLGGYRQWANGSGYLFRLGQQYVLVVPNPHGAFSLVLDVTVPKGQSRWAKEILAGWRDHAIANPYHSGQSPTRVSHIRPDRGRAARSTHFHSVSAAGIQASVPVNWNLSSHPDSAYLAQWLTGGLSTVAGVQFADVPSVQVHKDLVARSNSSTRVYMWAHRSAYVAVTASRHLSDLTNLTEVIRRTPTTALEVSVTVRTPDLKAGLHVLQSWQYDGLNPYRQAGKLLLPGKLTGARTTKWLHAQAF